MADVNESKPKPPKGTAPKGGTRYPRYGLKEAIEWARKLVSKTHNSPQPADIIYASVVDSKGPRGEIKVSALKQFGLLEGPSTAYAATDLAKAIAIAPQEELQPLYSRAALSPTLFKALYDTFHGDEISLAKLKQRAAELQVHPDNLESAISIYVASLSLAGLTSASGDRVAHQPTAMISINETTPEEQGDEGDSDREAAERGGEGAQVGETDELLSAGSGVPRAIFHVNVNLDASLDTDKLQRQLELLKRFGAI